MYAFIPQNLDPDPVRSITNTIVQGSQSLTHIFANHLTFDALISTFPRLILIALIPTFGANICDTARDLATRAPLEQVNMAEPEFWKKLELAEELQSIRCASFLTAAQIGLVVVFSGMSVMQWWCAVRVREYSGMLDGRVYAVEHQACQKQRRVMKV